MKIRMMSLAVAMWALLAAGALHAADPAPNENTKCPVSGKAGKADHAVEFNGGKVYFCCENCPKAFEGNKEKFAAKANLQLVQTGQLVEVACPLTGKKLNKATEIDIDGVKVAFCCNGCKGKVSKMSDDEKLKAVFGDTSKGFKAAAEASK